MTPAVPEPVRIRPVEPGDMPAVAAVYREEVLTGLASWEVDPPDAAEMGRRAEAVRAAGHPWLVAAAGDRLLGYAYASAYRPRAAYRFTVENSIYVAADARGHGVGRALLAALIAAAEARGMRQMVAVIGDSANAASIALHAALGFEMVGIARGVGFKRGLWLDQVLMQRPLGAGSDAPPAETDPRL